jgi:hypothetical protein
MKKIITALFCIISLNSFSQTPKWFVSFATGVNIGGPSVSIKSQMKKQGFDDESSFNFFGWTGTDKHPYKSQDLSLLLRFGKQITDNKTIYFVIGRLDKAKVEGFKNKGYTNLIFIGSSSGPNPYISYSLYQLTGGYMYTNPKSRVKLGIGPSVYMMDFTDGYEKDRSFTAGVTGTARFPLRKEKRQLGFEFIVETNLAAPIKLESNQGDATDPFKMKSANMISLNLGLALTFKKK